jgi:hypothetical protein
MFNYIHYDRLTKNRQNNDGKMNLIFVDYALLFPETNFYKAVADR